jgi:hypothetical protein
LASFACANCTSAQSILSTQRQSRLVWIYDAPDLVRKYMMMTS